LLDAIGQKTFVISEKPAAANLVKLSGNFLIAATIESPGEAIALARKAEIDAHSYVEILTGTLFSASTKPMARSYALRFKESGQGPRSPARAAPRRRTAILKTAKVLRAAPILSRPQWRRRRTPGILWILGGGIEPIRMCELPTGSCALPDAVLHLSESQTGLS